MPHRRAIEADDAPSAVGNYAQAVALDAPAGWLIVSGQIPADRDGAVPAGFGDQARLVWRNIEAQLRAGGMGLDDLVKVTIYLSDRIFADENRAVRQEVLGQRRVALTCIITGIFDTAWLLEIEAIAAK